MESVSIFNFPFFPFFFWSKLLNLQKNSFLWHFKKTALRKMKENTIMFIIAVFEVKKMSFAFLENSANIRRCNGSRKSLSMKIMNVWWNSYASMQWCILNQWKIHGNCSSFPLDISYRHFSILFYAIFCIANCIIVHCALMVKL